jgi:lysophospholipase L1-like esterase
LTFSLGAIDHVSLKNVLVKKALLFFVIVLVCRFSVEAQPFFQEVDAFSKIDAERPPPPNAILFIGSSSFKLWKGVDSSFPGKTIINRAFGGSSLTHQIDYIDKIIYPYDPRQILVYCGENDIAESKLVTADTVLQRFKRLHALIRNKYPKVPISFVSIKPSPVRAEFLSTVIESNKLIKSFCKKSKRTDFIDVFTPMLGLDNKPREDIFLSDRLHMNKNGYTIWKKSIEPYLIN